MANSSLQEFLALVAANYTPIVVILGVVICLAGIIRMLFSRNFAWTGLAVIFLGGVFAGIPLISKASIGADGLEIVTNLNEATSELYSAIRANRDAIDNLSRGLASIEDVVARGTSSAPSAAALDQIRTSLDRTQIELQAIDSASTGIAEKLRANESLIRALEQ